MCMTSDQGRIETSGGPEATFETGPPGAPFMKKKASREASFLKEKSCCISYMCTYNAIQIRVVCQI